jgi:hypothetical protein
MDQIMTETKIERVGKYWVVTGVINVVAGRLVNEPYQKVCKTRKQAERDVYCLNKGNEFGLEYYREQQAARMRKVSEYMMVRAKRAAEDAKQGSLFS